MDFSKSLFQDHLWDHDVLLSMGNSPHMILGWNGITLDSRMRLSGIGANAPYYLEKWTDHGFLWLRWDEVNDIIINRRCEYAENSLAYEDERFGTILFLLFARVWRSWRTFARQIKTAWSRDVPDACPRRRHAFSKLGRHESKYSFLVLCFLPGSLHGQQSKWVHRWAIWRAI